MIALGYATDNMNFKSHGLGRALRRVSTMSPNMTTPLYSFTSSLIQVMW